MIALGLASFASLSRLHAAPVQQADKSTEGKDKSAAGKNTDGKDKNTEQKRADATAEQRQMRDLDEQVQQTKSDVLSISAELNQLEEKLLYPSGTQVAIFVAVAKGDQMRLGSRSMVNWLRTTSIAPKSWKRCARAACNVSTSAM